ncbi:MAG TPA: response regulator [Armatimonadota bacterium]|jgi:DNA-binding response OmpR family regulator
MADTVTILAVDRNARNLELMQAFLEKNGYHVEIASTLDAMDRAILGRRTIRLALIDIAGFDRGIWERCERMRDAQIPFLVIFPRQQAAIQEESLEHGAQGALTKPLAQKQLLGLISGLLGEETE